MSIETTLKKENLSVREQASVALRKAALNEEAKTFVLNNPTLFQLLLKAARRFVAGENVDEALQTRAEVQSQGLATSLEFMGENVTTATEAIEATHEFLNIIKAIVSSSKGSRRGERVSLDLSHLGLFLDSKLGTDNFRLIAEASNKHQIDLFISAEGLDRTDDILDMYLRFSNEFPNVGITLQAYLHRTFQDLDRVLQRSRGKVRLVKGAYDGPKEQFLARSQELNERYVEMVKILFKAHRYCSIATHDSRIISNILMVLGQEKIDTSKYEFEMLFGIETEQLHHLLKQGHFCRQYLVYGKEWYLYLCNRIAENPENLFHAVVDIVR